MSNRASRGWEKRHAEMQAREVDADTLRYRELQDRKGQPAADLCFAFHNHAFTRAAFIQHSRRRVDSYDVYMDGKLVCTGGRVKVGLWLGEQL